MGEREDLALVPGLKGGNQEVQPVFHLENGTVAVGGQDQGVGFKDLPVNGKGGVDFERFQGVQVNFSGRRGGG